MLFSSSVKTPKNFKNDTQNKPVNVLKSKDLNLKENSETYNYPYKALKSTEFLYLNGYFTISLG